MNQSTQYNLAAILLLAVIALLILGLGAILFYDDDAEIVSEEISRRVDRLSSAPEATQQSRLIKEPPAPILLTPNARLYAPKDYEPEIIEQSGVHSSSQNGPKELDNIVDQETRPTTTSRPIRRQDINRRPPDRRFDKIPQEDTAVRQYRPQPPGSAPASRAPDYGFSRREESGTQLPADKMEPSVAPRGTVVPSYGAAPTYPRYQTPGTAQGYSQPYPQPYYSAPPAPRPNTGAGSVYPAPESRWRPPEQNPYYNPQYPQRGGYHDRYWDGR